MKIANYLWAAAAVAVLAACGGSSSSGQPSPQGTTTVTAGASPSPTSGATSSNTNAGEPAVNGAGTTLTPPRAPTTKAVSHSEDDNCYGLLDAHFRFGWCERYHSKLGTAVALVEYQNSQERDLVYKVQGATADLALRRVRTANSDAQDDNPAISNLEISDLVNDNTPKAIFEVPAGSGDNEAYDNLDVVEASGVVVLHLDLHGGVARKAFGGGLETYTPAAAGRATQRIYRYTAGAWRLASHRSINSDRIPDNTGF